MSRPNTQKQIYKSPSKREAHDLFLEESPEFYNDNTKALINTLYQTISEGISSDIGDKSISLCTSMIFSLFPEALYQPYLTVLGRDPDYLSANMTMTTEIRSFLNKDLDSINQKLESVGKEPVAANPEELEAISKFAVNYTLYVASDIHSYFLHTEKLDWRSAGMPDPRLPLKDQLKHIGYTKEDSVSL